MAKRGRSGIKKLLLGGVVVVIAAAIGALIYAWANNTPSSTVSNNAAQSTSKNTVKGTPSQPTPHQLPASNTNLATPGGATDQKGQTTSSIPPSSDWAYSNNGDITLQQPYTNETVKSGDTLSGLAKVSTVGFILTDNSVGQIAQGSLSVVNGKFSGILHFTPHSNSGKLQVYYPNPSNGAEEDLINIDVNFSS